MRAFSHCNLDHFDGCAGCKGDGKGDCGAVFIDVPPKGPAKWSVEVDWRCWLFGFWWQEVMAVIHIGPVCIMRVKV